MLFRNESLYSKNIVVTSQPAATGDKAKNGAALTAGDIVLMLATDTSGTAKAIVLASGNTIAVR